MPTHNSRTLGYESDYDDAIVKYRDADGVLQTVTYADIEDEAAETRLLAIINPGAGTVESFNDSYKPGTGTQYADTAGGDYLTTWTTGATLDYSKTVKNSLLFIDET